MFLEKHENIKVCGADCCLELMGFTKKEDGRKWKELFDMWKKLKIGMREYKSREPNFPEGLSEVAFCLYSGSKRFISVKGKTPASFDTFNMSTKRREQIKATSVGHDLTSFGPDSVWDDLYFLDFYNNGKLDGTFNVYKIPSGLIYNAKVNKNQTFKDQQKEKRRPRLSIMDIILKNEIKPEAVDVKVW